MYLFRPIILTVAFKRFQVFAVPWTPRLALNEAHQTASGLSAILAVGGDGLAGDQHGLGQRNIRSAFLGGSPKKRTAMNIMNQRLCLKNRTVISIIITRRRRRRRRRILISCCLFWHKHNFLKNKHWLLPQASVRECSIRALGVPSANSMAVRWRRVCFLGLPDLDFWLRGEASIMALR